MPLEPGLYIITTVDSSASVCHLGESSSGILSSEKHLVIAIEDYDTGTAIRIEFAIAKSESDGQYTLTDSGSNGKVIVSQDQVVVSQLPDAVPEVWRFVPRGEDLYSIEIATKKSKNPPEGWYYKGDPITNILIKPDPCYWRFKKV